MPYPPVLLQHSVTLLLQENALPQLQSRWTRSLDLSMRLVLALETRSLGKRATISLEGLTSELETAAEEARVARKSVRKVLVNCILYSWYGLDL
jgi:hypothetical protein